MDQKPYGAMLRGKLPYSALQLAPRNLHDIPLIPDTTRGPGATQAALRAQVEHENKMKQESKEVLVRNYSNRIASLLATSMRPNARLKLRKLQATHALPLYLTFNARRRADVQGTHGRAGKSTRRLRR
eukprot:1191611-Pleurochrysis_carterae.AAC.1